MRLLRAVRRLVGSQSSEAYEIIDGTAAEDGWRSTDIAHRQHRAYQPLLEELRAGRPRIDFVVAAGAVRESGLRNPHVLEIGCGSGYYSEILTALAGPIRYTGVDYSPSMIHVARQAYARERFAVGDATRLPFRDASFDIALSGNSLMHISAYGGAINETARVARRWCVFHNVPVLEQRPTTRLRKQGYGVTVFELVFNRAELESLFDETGLTIRSVRDTFAYDLAPVVGEHTRLLTYACEKRS